MEIPYSNEDVLNLFSIYGECQKVVSRTCRTFNERYPHLPPITNKKFRHLQTNFVTHGSIKPKKVYLNTIILREDTVTMVLAYFYANPRSSIRAAEVDLGISYSSIQRILRNHGIHNYKFTPVQGLQPGDFDRRIQLCEMLLLKHQEDHSFFHRIIWTDESNFSRNGIFNRRNEHFWSDVNPHIVQETRHQMNFRFNVFCLMMDNRIKFHVYDDNLDQNRYIEILRTVVEDFLDDLPLNIRHNSWYQLDGAPAHCTFRVSNELNRMFEDRWIRRLGPWEWAPRSPDLTPVDFFLWGVVKTKVYASPVNTRAELLERVTAAFEELDPVTIRAATQSVRNRCLKCLEVGGRHFEQYP